MRERRQRRLRHLLRHFRYSLEFREDRFGAQYVHHLSLVRFRVPAAPSLHAVPRVGSRASSLLRAAPTPIVRRVLSSHQLSLPRFGFPCSALTAFRRRRWVLPGSWKALAYVPRFYDPGGIASSLVIRDVALLSTWRCCLPPKRRRRLPRPSDSRGSITRPARSLSTLRRQGHPLSRRKTRSRVVTTFPCGTRTRRAPS